MQTYVQITNASFLKSNIKKTMLTQTIIGAYFMPGTGLAARDLAVSKIRKSTFRLFWNMDRGSEEKYSR